MPLSSSIRFILKSTLAFAPLLLQAAPPATQSLIRVNQIGYLPDSNKVAVIADPQIGQNADESFTPGDTYEIRRWEDDSIVFTGSPAIWNEGATHSQSGDRGWWFDFSSVSEKGQFYVWDVENEVGSFGFEIGNAVYDDVLVAAMRTFYYQRLATAKPAEFAGDDWVDEAAFIGDGQDGETRSVYDRENPDTERDLSGGWMDAGDYNKYVTFAEGPVHQLLNAYLERPQAFGDDTNIPESGNGIPDILDELHFEMQWVSKMQEEDGGVLIKMGNTAGASASPPSEDTRPRYYVPACSSSTIAAAGMYAHAALVFRQYAPWQDFAQQLEYQAEAAWAWYHANPKNANCDEQIVQAGDADRDLESQERSAFVAAMYLHQLTEDDQYGQFVTDNFTAANAFTSGFYSVYTAFAAEALLHYINSPFAPDSIRNTVIQRKLALQNGDVVTIWSDTQDLYRAYLPNSQYHWGSLFVSANFANANLDYQTFGYAGADLEESGRRAEGLLDYFFGVNAMGLVYLTRMEDFGAENSIQEIYHSWFAYDSDWDTNPPPAYIPGGPNASYNGSVEELKNLPPQKSYLDFNDSWPQNSWEITENAIYYQAAFVKMLSKFVSEPETDLEDDDGDGIANSFEDWFGFTQGEADSWNSRASILLDEGQFTIAVLRSKAASHGLVKIHYSYDLENWIRLDELEALVSEASENLNQLSFHVPAGDNEKLFLRFSLEGNSQIITAPE